MNAVTEQAYQQIIRQQQKTIRLQAETIRRQQARIAELEQLVAQLMARVEELSAQVARLSKNSSNSSKPPSSDITKPPKPPTQNGGRRHLGGQPGHARHERTPFVPDQIDRTIDYRPDRCPDCGVRMRPVNRPPRTLQQVELPEIPLVITEHRAHAAWCPHCRRTHYAALPPEIEKAGLVGPRLSALVAWLKGVGHCSFSTTGRFCRDVLRLGLSRGQLAKIVGVEFGPLEVDEKDAMIHELDAVVAHLYGLSEKQLVHIFETLHEGWEYHPRLDAVLRHCRQRQGCQ